MTGVTVFRCFNLRVREHALMLGMLLPADENFLWIAEESLLAPLPEGGLLSESQTNSARLRLS